MRAFLVQNGVVVQKGSPTLSADDYGGGWVDGPDHVTPGWLWDGTDFTTPVPDPAEALAAERAAMSTTRGRFLIAAVGAEIITEATAEEAAGGGWPAAFNTFLAGLTGQQRIAAKAAWADGDTVRRNNPILALIAADQGVTDTQVDDLFRAAMTIEVE